MKKEKNITGLYIDKHVRITTEMEKLINVKAAEMRTSVSDFIRKAIEDAINRNLTDTELIYSSLVDLKRKNQYQEDKIELLSILIFELVKHQLKVLPDSNLKSEEMLEIEMENFKNECLRSFKKNHGSLLESMVLNIYEKSGQSDGNID